MNIIRLVLSVVAAFATYGILYTVHGMLLYPEMSQPMEGYRTQEDAAYMYMMIGHFFETLVIVLTYYVFVKSNDLKKGFLFGALFGGYFAATQIMSYGTFVAYKAAYAFEFIPVHIIVGGIVGMVLAFIYKEPATE